MTNTQSGRKSPPPEYFEQRQERLGIAASEFRIDVEGITEEEARERALEAARTYCLDMLQSEFESDQPVVFEALMGLGKSRGAVQLAHRLDEPITFLCGRGHKGQYQQILEWCKQFGLKAKRLPSFHADCETARGDHGEPDKNQVQEWHDRGATPADIHNEGSPPCIKNGDCNYQESKDFNTDEYDVLVGNYTHGYVEGYVEGRTVIIDEFPGESYIQTFSQPQKLVSGFLKNSEIRYNSFTDLLNRRDSGSSFEADFLEATEDVFQPRGSKVVQTNTETQHAKAPLLTYALLEMEELNSTWEWTQAGKHQIAHNKDSNTIHLLQPPMFDKAEQVIGLDGTPSIQQWNVALGYHGIKDGRLSHRRILSDTEKQKFTQDILDISIIQTTGSVYPYSSGNYVNVDRDTAYLKSIRQKHNSKPQLFTTEAAEKEYDTAGTLNQTSGVEHFGNIRGSNAYTSDRLAVILGSPHFGDTYVEKWCALFGSETTRKGKGSDLTYSGYGSDILHQMREQSVAQAIMRVGRDGDGASVYVHTSAIPEWMPVTQAAESVEVQRWTEKQRRIIEAVEGSGRVTTSELSDHPKIDSSHRHVSEVLHHLAELGHLKREDTGKGYIWTDININEISLPVGVDLPQSV